MTIDRPARLLLALFLVAVAWISAPRGALAQEVPTLKIGTSQNEAGLGTIPFLLALRNGYFAREGVNIELVRFGGPTLIDVLWNQYAGLEKGDVALIRSQAAFLIERVMKGGDFVGIAGNTTNPVYSLLARPDIGSFADLKGKTVALTYANDLITVGTRALMELHGLAAGDVTIQAIEGSPPRMECVRSGRCGAVSVGQPADFAAVALGYHRLGVTNEIGPLVFGVDVVTNAWARTHREIVVRYLRAMAAALRYANDPAHDAEMLSLIAETAKTDADVSRAILQDCRNPKYQVLSRQGEIDRDAFAHVLALEGKYGQLPLPLPDATRFIDRAYLEAAGIK
jgi:ABC-type nitrate/sulfonate/bicarbonate transport system substrate-binding protein